MPRGKKCRQVCQEYPNQVFSPKTKTAESITVTVDELEAMRLCDYEGLDQEQCSVRMGVSRGTYQRILYEARKKVVEALVEGKRISIDGGNYVVATDNCGFQKKCKKCRWTLGGRDTHSVSE